MRNFYFLPGTAVFKNAGWLKNRCIPVFLLIISLLFTSTLVAQPGVQWEYSRVVTLSAPTPLANFQIKIELNGAAEHAHMNSNGSDLRFYAGTVECSYWIETFNPAGKSVIWVKVPATGTAALTMYYGYPTATTNASGENTFDFFDGFEGTTLSSKWVNHSEVFAPGTITVNGGEVNLANKGGYTSMYAKYDTTNLSDSYIIEMKHKETGYYRNRFYVTDEMRPGNNPTRVGTPETGLWSDYEYGPYATGYVISAGGVVTRDTNYLMRWAITRSSGEYIWSNHNYSTDSQISSEMIFSPALTFLNISLSENTYQSTIIDWARIRKAGIDPSITFGSESVRVPVPSISTVSTLTGCEGEQFTLTGTFPTNFGHVVKVGTTTLQIVSETDTVIIAKFGTVSGALTVTTTAGASAENFTINATALPEVNAGSALPFICSQGTSAALGGTVTGGLGVTGVWSVNIPGGIFNTPVDYKTTTWTAPTGFSGQATFTLTGANGTCTVLATKILMVNTTPTGTVMVSDDKDFCVGESITFTAPSGYTGYEFLITQGAITSTINNAGNPVYTASNLQPGATVKVKVTNSGCIATLDTEVFTVNAIPSGTINSSDVSGNTPNDGIICMGEAINFSFSTTTYTKYKFILNGLTVLKESNESYLLNQTNLVNGDKITVEVTGPGGCSKLFGPITVSVRDNPIGTLTSNMPGDAICLGGSITFSASSGFVNYEFFLNDDSKKNGSSASYLPIETLVTNDEVAVRIKNINGCYLLTPPIQVTVNPLPAKPTILTGGQPTVFCVGEGRNINLSVNVPANPNYTYQWYKDGGTLGTSTPILNLTLVSESGSYSVSFVNENGCTSPKSDPVLVTIHPVAAKPTITASGPLVFCEGGNVVLTASTAATYQWYSGTTSANLTPISGQTSQAITLTDIAQTGYNAVAITNVNGCAGAAISDIKSVTVNELPATPAITIASGTLEHCEGNSVTLSAPPSFTVYKWFKNGIEIAGATSQNYTTPTTLAAAGTYTIVVINSKGCQSAFSPGIIVTINPLPLPTIDNGVICLGSVGDYKTELGKGDYVWSIVGAGTINSGQGTNAINVIWGTTPGAKSLNVTYTDGKGCRSISQAVFANLPALVPTITGEQTVCISSTKTYTTESAGGETDYTWAISNGSVISGGSTNENTIEINWTVPGAQSVSVNYTKNGCSAAVPTIYPVTVTPLPVGNFSYAATPYCINGTNPLPTMATGATKGSFTAATGLIIKTATGEVNLAASTPGTYTVYNTIAAAGGCAVVIESTDITITILPTATLGYSNSPFCTSDNMPKTIDPMTGVGAYTGGTFTAPTGLTIDPGTGTINPYNNTPGSYNVTYTIPASAGCPMVVVTTPVASPVVITQLPVVNLSYTKHTWCKSEVGSKSPIWPNGSTGIYMGGTFSVTPAVGLAVNTSGNFNMGASAAGEYIITYTTLESAGCGAVSDTFKIIITAIPTATISYNNIPACNTVTSLPVTLSGSGVYAGGTYSASAALNINTVTGEINPSASTPGTYTITYTTPAAGGCAAVPATTSITISPKPEVSAGENWATCVGEGPVNITQGAATTFAGSVLWTGGAGTWSQATSLTQATYEPAPAETGDITLTLTATGINGCAANTSVATKKLTINTISAPVFIVPENAPALCVGGIQPFISVKNNVSDFSTGILTSSTSNLDIPDNTTSGVSKSISVSGIPGNAVITSVEINFNVAHTYNGDLTINLKAANNKVLNIANSLSGPGFTNTNIISTSTNPIQTSGDIGPFTGTYAAQMRYGTQGATSVSGNRAFAKSFDELFSNPNGNWILSVRDGGAGDYGTFNSWSITIKYSTPIDPIPVLWTINGNEIPDNLYLDASATTPYTGDARSVVYAKPTEASSFNYTATSINGNGCKASKNFTLNINPSPKVYIKADYCENALDGKITLDAMGVDNPTSYSWSTGETTASVLVDIAHEYYVSVTNLEGCTGTGILSVAEELVSNGDFELGNTDFYTEYVNMPMPNPKHPFLPSHTGLVDEGTYAVDSIAYDYHLQFHGRDHTTSEQKGKFLMVNGKADLTTTAKYPASHTRIIWEQTVSVLPNTDYYFSAWAMNFSGNGSTTQLQFEVNGLPLGTVAKLADISSPQNEDEISISNWIRFYNGITNGIDDTWNSGENTEATIRIVNLSNVESGNDFGLDDISFGTLAPFVSGPDVSGRDEQTICVGESIQPIVYKVGSGDEPIDGLPAVFNNDFDGLYYTISGGNLAVPGVYEYVLSTTGSCPIPATATGKITVLDNSQIVLTSSQPDATLCLNSNILSPITFMVSGTATGTEFIGLPAGMSSAYNSTTGEASISGFSTETGTFNYKVRTSSICKKDSLAGVIIIDALPVAGLISSPAVCLNDDGVIKVSGFSGAILGWASSEDGTNYIPIVNNITDTVAFTNITQNTYYKVQVGNGVCTAVYSEAVAVSIQNLWQGKLSSAWDNPFNWASGSVPEVNTAVCAGTVTIPKVANLNKDPILTISATVTNLSVLTGGNLTLNAGGNLQIGGNVTNAGIIDARNGGIEYIGNFTKSIEPGIFLNNAIGDLKINNKNRGLILNAPIDVYRSVSFGNAPQNLITNDQLTLKSTKEQTASLGNMTGQTIIGKATVERYINTGEVAQGAHRKSWQLLATPTQGQTIQESWQEGAVSNGLTPIQNPKSGYGTLLNTGHNNVPGNGYDLYTPAGTSIKVFDPLTGEYDGGPVSTNEAIYNPKGYMVLIRGDRSVYTSNAPAKSTTLRTKGTVITGSQSLNIPVNSFGSVGNPYASAVSIKDIARTGGVNEFIYVWDPLLTGAYGLGGIATLSEIGTSGVYSATPASGSYPGQITQIQSGQAFFVQSTDSAGTVGFTEASKTSGSAMVMRPFGRAGRTVQLKTNLYGLNPDGSAFISDGNLVEFGEDYSNEIDGKDARKISNTSENLGIASNHKLLAIERRQPVRESDTLFFNLSGVRVQNYRFELLATGLEQEGLEGFLEDTYLRTKTPLNLEGSTLVDFNIENKPGSYATDRFRVVFKAALGPLPVTLLDLLAAKKEDGILVQWKVENQVNIRKYEIEKSNEGLYFSTIGELPAGTSLKYSWLDKVIEPGFNYYRLRSVDENGKNILSGVVKVLVQNEPSDITIFPNPISNGVMNVHLVNQPSGKYKIKLLNPVGQVMINKQINHIQGNSTEKITWDYKMARGMYQLEVTKPDGGIKIIKVIY